MSMLVLGAQAAGLKGTLVGTRKFPPDGFQRAVWFNTVVDALRRRNNSMPRWHWLRLSRSDELVCIVDYTTGQCVPFTAGKDLHQRPLNVHRIRRTFQVRNER